MTDEVESFADYPRSVAEMRSDRSGSASDWTARDALIDVLRQIDRGEIKADVLLVAWSYREKDGARVTDWRAASPDPLLTAGLAQRLVANVVAAR